MHITLGVFETRIANFSFLEKLKWRSAQWEHTQTPGRRGGRCARGKESTVHASIHRRLCDDNAPEMSDGWWPEMGRVGPSAGVLPRGSRTSLLLVW